MDESTLQHYRKKMQQLLEELRRTSESSSETATPVAPDNAIGRLTRVDAMQSQQLATALIAQNRLRIMRLEQALAFNRCGQIWNVSQVRRRDQREASRGCS